MTVQLLFEDTNGIIGICIYDTDGMINTQKN